MAQFTVDDLRFWCQVIEDSKRTVYCPPDLESRLDGLIRAHNLAGLWNVVATPACPEDKIIIVDHNALAATLAAILNRVGDVGGLFP